MKQINEYLISKAKTKTHEFPIKPDKEKLIDFLKYNGFVEHRSWGVSSEEHKPKLWYDAGPYDDDEMTHWIEFGDNDVVYLIRTLDESRRVSRVPWFRKTTMKYDRLDEATDYESFEELREEIMKHFGF